MTDDLTVTLTREQVLDLLDAANDRIEQMEDQINTEAPEWAREELTESLTGLQNAHDALHRQAFVRLHNLMEA